jgi:hypothetical protein
MAVAGVEETLDQRQGSVSVIDTTQIIINDNSDTV